MCLRISKETNHLGVLQEKRGHGGVLERGWWMDRLERTKGQAAPGTGGKDPSEAGEDTMERKKPKATYRLVLCLHT